MGFVKTVILVITLTFMLFGFIKAFNIRSEEGNLELHSEAECQGENVKFCINSGGKCSKKNGRLECVCEYGEYDENMGCRVHVAECIHGNMFCLQSGGMCSKKTGTVECVCKNGEYNANEGCPVSDAECNNENTKLCLTTGGMCSKNTGTVECLCENGEYNANEGCPVSDAECKDFKKFCLQSGGMCSKKRGALQCFCENGEYNENEGCPAEVTATSTIATETSMETTVPASTSPGTVVTETVSTLHTEQPVITTTAGKSSTAAKTNKNIFIYKSIININF